MRLTERKIWLLPLLLLAFWLGGCSSQYDGSEIEEPTTTWEPDLSLVLSIYSGDRSKASRADAVPPVFETADLDMEKMNSLRVIIVDKKAEMILHNDYRSSLNHVTSLEGLKYAVEFDTEYTVYLLANEEGLPNYKQSDFDALAANTKYPAGKLEDMTIGVAAGWPYIDNGSTPVPMTEIFTVTTVKREEAETLRAGSEGNEVVQNETFFVTRAAVKFSFFFFRKGIFLDDDARTIKRIKISGIGDREYLFPKNATYSPDKDTNRDEDDREITAFDLPTGATTGAHAFGLPAFNGGTDPGLKVTELIEKPSSFDEKQKKFGLTDDELARSFFAPLLYFPESKGQATGNKFECTIAYGDDEYLEAQALTNLPYGLPRNTHVVVVVTINDSSIEATVDVIPFTDVVLNPDYGLKREEYTGYVYGGTETVDGQTYTYWYDGNYYESDDPEKPTKPTRFYLGATENGDKPQPVTINGIQYMLVYTDGYNFDEPNMEDVNKEVSEDGKFIGYEKIGDHIVDYKLLPGYTRKSTNLYMIYDITNNKKYYLTNTAITGYEEVYKDGQAWMEYYVNDYKQRVWLDEYQINPWYRTINEYDRLDWNRIYWNLETGVTPKYWWDVFGNRYPWSEGDTEAKRRAALANKIGEGWIQYLEWK